VGGGGDGLFFTARRPAGQRVGLASRERHYLANVFRLLVAGLYWWRATTKGAYATLLDHEDHWFRNQ
jgi:hypothetical protein